MVFIDKLVFLVAGLLLRKSVQRTASVTDSSMPVHDATLDHTRGILIVL